LHRYIAGTGYKAMPRTQSPAELLSARKAARPPVRPVADPRLPNRLREHRLALNLTLRDVADELGITVPTLSQIELGRVRPSFQMVRKLAGFYRRPIEDLWPETAEAGKP
jgi:DNA-binding XRE family transcriptional regulator